MVSGADPGLKLLLQQTLRTAANALSGALELGLGSLLLLKPSAAVARAAFWCVVCRWWGGGEWTG